MAFGLSETALELRASVSTGTNKSRSAMVWPTLKLRMRDRSPHEATETINEIGIVSGPEIAVPPN